MLTLLLPRMMGGCGSRTIQELNGPKSKDQVKSTQVYIPELISLKFQGRFITIDNDNAYTVGSGVGDLVVRPVSSGSAFSSWTFLGGRDIRKVATNGKEVWVITNANGLFKWNGDKTKKDDFTYDGTYKIIDIALGADKLYAVTDIGRLCVRSFKAVDWACDPPSYYIAKLVSVSNKVLFMIDSAGRLRSTNLPADFSGSGTSFNFAIYSSPSARQLGIPVDGPKPFVLDATGAVDEAACDGLKNCFNSFLPSTPDSAQLTSAAIGGGGITYVTAEGSKAAYVTDVSRRAWAQISEKHNYIALSGDKLLSIDSTGTLKYQAFPPNPANPNAWTTVGGQGLVKVSGNIAGTSIYVSDFNQTLYQYTPSGLQALSTLKPFLDFHIRDRIYTITTAKRSICSHNFAMTASETVCASVGFLPKLIAASSNYLYVWDEAKKDVFATNLPLHKDSIFSSVGLQYFGGNVRQLGVSVDGEIPFMVIDTYVNDAFCFTPKVNCFPIKPVQPSFP
ncbi:hypothetical protein HDU97_001040 [Phlyctochytrium planicorne]|nr:hypothetical protein HDU97_001040 [Phlyctochytrium planicorne]